MSNSPQNCGQHLPVSLETLGWDDESASAFSKYTGPYIPGRVACRQRTVYDVFIEGGSVLAGISGSMRKLGRFPAVGDFVVLLHRPEAGATTIVDILPRKTVFTRGVAGNEGTDQVIAANITTIFIVTAAGPDLNARRLERYLAVVHASGASPVIVINKSDLLEDPSTLVAEISPVTAGIPVVCISALTGNGISQLDPWLTPGITIALIGSSGVGKSTLINTLLEQSVQETTVTRDYDGKGRHKTTVRQMFVLKSGALMIDNPGLREVGIGTAGSGISDTFPDIVELAGGCRFSDCRHEQEPGCAVREAVSDGILSPSRLDNYLRLMRELAFEQEKSAIGLVRIERKRWKGIGKLAKDIRKGKWE
ncbi:MAG TPA: ribosome small subunit-dependent GTPase A [Methanoregula sp.]|nr:ribosome small subunit-dependent GTPase A [Methanoregula sp.]